MSEPSLFPEITVHCFACPKAVTGFTPEEAHDLMEAHYRDRHAGLIARLVGGIRA